jgi:xylulokinase
VFLGIDIGTSAVKIVIADEQQKVVAQASESLQISHPQPLWLEQNPEDWWRATCQAIFSIREQGNHLLESVSAIGLSGQMHGAVLLDDKNEILRPAILWNDGRSHEQCKFLNQSHADILQQSGNLAMPGFTAPKLLWLAQHEKQNFCRVCKVLLPKDYIRFRLTGEFASDMSDASGTLWLDVAKRRWSDELLQLTGLSETQMPELYEGNEATGQILPQVASMFGLKPKTIVAGGGGDNACGAVGLGTVNAGQAFISLGTSGVYFVSGDKFAPNPGQAMHAFCHAVPQTWHQMSVILSAASCLSWVVRLTAARDEQQLFDEIEADFEQCSDVLFLPYLSGERTPHNDPMAKGVFFGMDHATTRAQLGRAVLEAVAMALADGQQALINSGVAINDVAVIGGGSKSLFWGKILASVLDRPLRYYDNSESGPAFGATRLARMAVTGESVTSVCKQAEVRYVIEPNNALRNSYQDRYQRFRRLYLKLKDEFVSYAA